MKKGRFNTALCVWLFVLLAGAAACHAWLRPGLYESHGLIAVLERADPAAMAELETDAFLERVAWRIAREAGMGSAGQPEAGSGPEGASRVRMLRRDGIVRFDRHDGFIVIGFRHRDREAASRIAWCWMGEVIATGARRHIDESMKQVEALKPVARRKEEKIAEIKRRLADEASKAGASSGSEDDLKRELLAEQRELDEIMARLRDATMIVGPSPSFYRVLEKPWPAAEGDYARGPVLRGLAWGTGAALVVAVAAGWVFRTAGEAGMKRRFSWKAMLARPSGSVERILVLAVLASGAMLSVLHALAAPRVYEASALLALSAEARRDYGWDELGVGELEKWRPEITRRVILYFSGAPMRWGAMGDLTGVGQVAAAIRKGLSVRRRGEGMELLYRHEDPVVAGRALEAFVEAYERYPMEWERRNPDFQRRRLVKQKAGGMSPKPVLIAEWSRWPGDYLLSPIVLKICLGCGVTLICAAAGLLAKRMIGRLVRAVTIS